MKQAKTMELKGNKYAKVPERLKLFREDNPRGRVETTPTITDTHVIVKAYILKDKKDPNSADATGHAMETAAKVKGEKAFEKLETVALGRALANLGYLASGEIASAEEMEEFEEHKQTMFMEEMGEHSESLEAAKSLEELKEAWSQIPGKFHTALNELKNQRKLKLNENVKTGTKQPRVAGVAKGKGDGKQGKGNTRKTGK